jgi:hypothetical protein
MLVSNTGLTKILAFLGILGTVVLGILSVPEMTDRWRWNKTKSIQKIEVYPKAFEVREGENILVTERRGEYKYTARWSPVIGKCHVAKVDVNQFNGSRVIYEMWLHSSSCDEYWRE